LALLHFDLDWSCQSHHCVNPLQALGRPELKRMHGVDNTLTRNPGQRERERFRRLGEGGKAPDRALW